MQRRRVAKVRPTVGGLVIRTGGYGIPGRLDGVLEFSLESSTRTASTLQEETSGTKTQRSADSRWQSDWAASSRAAPAADAPDSSRRRIELAALAASHRLVLADMAARPLCSAVGLLNVESSGTA